MLTDLWEPNHSSSTRFIIGIRNNIVKHLPVPSAKHGIAVAQELSRRGWDAYFAPAGFAGDRRRATDAIDVAALWVDLDCGPTKQYPDAKAALTDLIGWCRREGVAEPTHIISSGNGLHCYWLLDAGVPHDVWKPVAMRLKQSLRVAGVHADPTRTADAASILRVPGTQNLKDPDNPLEVKTLRASDQRIRLDDFAASLPHVGPQRVVHTPTDPEWETRAPLPEGDAAVIGAQCKQMQHVKNQLGAVEEPYWRAALSVLKRCHRGDTLIHDWSRGDDRYDPQQTQAKADATEGPATCAHFDEVNPGGCAGCPWAGKVRSPIQIAVAAPEPAPVADEPWRVSRVGRYTVQSGGVWFTPMAGPDAEPEPPVHVADYPIWVVEVRERVKLHHEQTDGALILLEWVSVDGRTKRGTMKQTELFEPARFRDWIAEAGLAIATWDWAKMKNYISQLTAQNLRTHGVVRYHEVLGWYDDNATFVVGDRQITQNDVKPALIQNRNPISKLTKPPRGSLEAWTDAVNKLADPRYHKHAFALFASLGSPLLGLADKQSAVLSLAGISAAGKTVSMRLGMSVWGNPEFLVQGANSSLKAVERQLTTNRHVPFGLDETTQYSHKQMASLVYMAANGMGDAKLHRDGTNRDVGSWQNVTYVTTNRAILDWSQTQITEAHRRRVLEFFFTAPMDREVGVALYNASSMHYGLACEPYVQAVMRVRDQIPALINQTEKDLTQSYWIPDAQRFGLWTIAAAKVGAAIAQAAGLFTLPINDIIATAVQALSDNASGTLESNVVAMDTINEWLSEHNRNICYWNQSGQGVPVFEPVARVMGKNLIAVHRARLNDVLGEAGISPRAAVGVFAPPVRVQKDRRVRLSPDAPGVWCYMFDPEKLGFEVEPPSEFTQA